jgi:hypothetical protein
MTALPNMTKMLGNLATPSSIQQLWGVLKGFPGGKLMMSRLMGRMAPYTDFARRFGQ